MKDLQELAKQLSSIGAPPGSIRVAQIKAIFDALSRIRQEAFEEAAKVAEKEADYWVNSDSYKEHPTDRWHTANTIAQAIKEAQ
jgi:hypothetical protein